MPKVEFTAKISKIDAKGTMTVQFSDSIVSPQNYSSFNDQFIRIQIINGEDDAKNKTLQSWKIVEFRDTEMDL